MIIKKMMLIGLFITFPLIGSQAAPAEKSDAKEALRRSILPAPKISGNSDLPIANQFQLCLLNDCCNFSALFEIDQTWNSQKISYLLKKNSAQFHVATMPFKEDGTIVNATINVKIKVNRKDKGSFEKSFKLSEFLGFRRYVRLLENDSGEPELRVYNHPVPFETTGLKKDLKETKEKKAS